MNLNTFTHRVTEMIDQMEPPERVKHTPESSRAADLLVVVFSLAALIGGGFMVMAGYFQ